MEMKGECNALFPKHAAQPPCRLCRGPGWNLTRGFDWHGTACKRGYPNSLDWLCFCSTQPTGNCPCQAWEGEEKQLSEDVPGHTEVFCTNTNSETPYRNSGYFCGLVHEGTELNKYLPKEAEALLEVPALPLSHKSLFFPEFDYFAFVVYLC